MAVRLQAEELELSLLGVEDRLIKVSSVGGDLRVMDLVVDGADTTGSSVTYAKAEEIQQKVTSLRIDAVRVG